MSTPIIENDPEEYILYQEAQALEPPARARIEVSGFDDYLDHQMTNDFDQDTGLVILPVAAGIPAHKVIRLHGGMGTRIVNWKTSRMGKPPICPAAENSDEDTFLRSNLHTDLPKPNKAGGYDWTMSGTYVYVQKEPRVPGEASFPVGDYPFIVLPAMATAGSLVSGSLGSYSGDLPFQSFIAACWAELCPTGQFSSGDWPILAYPAPLFSHNHMI